MGRSRLSMPINDDALTELRQIHKRATRNVQALERVMRRLSKPQQQHVPDINQRTLPLDAPSVQK